VVVRRFSWDKPARKHTNGKKIECRDSRITSENHAGAILPRLGWWSGFGFAAKTEFSRLVFHHKFGTTWLCARLLRTPPGKIVTPAKGKPSPQPFQSEPHGTNSVGVHLRPIVPFPSPPFSPDETKETHSPHYQNGAKCPLSSARENISTKPKTVVPLQRRASDRLEKSRADPR